MMEKIPTIFQRDPAHMHLVTKTPTSGTEWVHRGLGTPRRKWDGTCCRFWDGILWKRYAVRPGRRLPDDFMPAESADPLTGKQSGWIPVGDGPEDRWYCEALEHLASMQPIIETTYELVGPKIQGNPEGLPRHVLLAHICAPIIGRNPRTWDELRAYFAFRNIEGIVWHHPDGRMAKIKGRDFGIQRPVLEDTP